MYGHFFNIEGQTSFETLYILTNQLFQGIAFLSLVHKMTHSNPRRNSYDTDVYHACSQYLETSACILGRI